MYSFPSPPPPPSRPPSPVPGECIIGGVRVCAGGAPIRVQHHLRGATRGLGAAVLGALRRSGLCAILHAREHIVTAAAVHPQRSQHCPEQCLQRHHGHHLHREDQPRRHAAHQLLDQIRTHEPSVHGDEPVPVVPQPGRHRRRLHGLQQAHEHHRGARRAAWRHQRVHLVLARKGSLPGRHLAVHCCEDQQSSARGR